MRKRSQRTCERGFTAIEITMVATVIAILALIVIPIFRARVDEAKIAAAQSDLSSFMKAEQLVQADTGFYVRLEDLDNVMNSDPEPLPPNWTGITIETPPVVFLPGYNPDGSDRIQTPWGLTRIEWHGLAGSLALPKFKGPYTAITRAIPYGELRAGGSILLRSSHGFQYAPIRDLPQGGSNPPLRDGQLFDSVDNRIPADPWGNPYLFFPASGETTFNYSSIISMGPNGLPGDGNGPTNVREAYLREFSPTLSPNNPERWLGRGDDLEKRF
jgi:prepilin-type N-terminal cleavage/methylation domain-containing protein